MTQELGERGAVFVLPTSTSGQQGPVAGWLSTAGWAAAAARVIGASWIVTPGGEIDVRAARRGGSDAQLRTPATTSWKRRIPTVAKTAAKDVRQAQRARRFHIDPAAFADRDVAFVWQRHELFHTAGLDLARALGVPSVVFVPATHVWEAEQWGTHRPGWGRYVERYGERPALARADVVACGTDMVARQVLRIGARARSIVITPTGVDLELFRSPNVAAAGAQIRETLGLRDRFVVGWVGSFRRFHALDQAVDAVAGIDDAALLLVGDGPERPRVEQYAREQGVTVVTTGTVSHPDLPAYLAAMDVGLVLAGRNEVFHYSPLKLGEYLAAGLAVIAPAVPQIEARLTEGVDARLVPPGDPVALARALHELHDDPDSRRRIAVAGHEAAEARFAWDQAVVAIQQHLAAVRPSG
jgi:glycosyltransferase involved in cell wall biosynthesis